MSSFLPETASIPAPHASRLESDYESFREGLPADLRAHCLETYGVDIAGEYAGEPIANPFGKASGQLSLNVAQVRRDVGAGLGFVVLKTVIAQNEQGAQKMWEWAIPETRMRVERITGEDGTEGWTITWKGRGWHESFESYCRFFGEALDTAGAGTRIAPSVKYHLPAAGEGEFSEDEYRYTTQKLLEVWQARREGPMPLEKDFSPTLAGDDRSREQEQILTWLRRVPELIRDAGSMSNVKCQMSNGDALAHEGPSPTPKAQGPTPITLGVKLMNARFGPEFQEEMFRVLVDESAVAPDYVVYANRLFDPGREFEGKVGVAYGGPDLGRRNLEALRRVSEAALKGRIRRPLPTISATGDILTGKRAVEYGLLGATSCQMHTVFQLPDREFGGTTRNKTAAVLHHLVLHPRTGLVAWLLHLGDQHGGPVHWLDLPRLGRELLERDG